MNFLGFQDRCHLIGATAPALDLGPTHQRVAQTIFKRLSLSPSTGVWLRFLI